MTALTWETLLLLAAAYLAGCCIGCIARRRTGRRRAEQPAVQPSEQQPVQEPAASLPKQQPAPLTPMRPASPQVARSMPNLAHEPFRRADAPAQATADPIIEPADPVVQSTKAVARFERALSGEGDGLTSPVAEANATRRAVAAAPSRPLPGDDLKRIRGIDPPLEQRLHALEVMAFTDVAQWTAADVARISRELGFKGRIQQENWIEQALILSKGADTLYSRRIARGEAAAARAIEDEGEPRSLHEMRTKPRPIDDAPGSAARVAASKTTREITAASGRVAESGTRQVERDRAPDVSGRAAFGDKPSMPVADATPRAVAETRAQAALDDTAAAGQDRPAIGAVRDNFQRIRGINAEIERLLLEQGVRRYGQIASWGKADTERLDRLLGQEGRVARENWIEQAQILAKGGDTAYSRDYDRRGGVEQSGARPPQPPKLAEAIREHLEAAGESNLQRPSDVSSLRSVKSEALGAADATAAQGPTASGGRIGRLATADDLKRIRGVGVLIEKKLHAAGVTAYEHIANWTAADIDRVSRLLDFKGRIERENWVEQARILASGGQTEFSRRVDRGEVVTSRIREP